MVVVDRQSALPPTATAVALTNPADGTLTTLLIEQGLVFFGRTPPPTSLAVLLSQGQAIAAAVLSINEPRKLFADLLPPTALANHQTVVNTPVMDPMKALSDEVSADNAERYTRLSGNLTDRKAETEQVSDLVQSTLPQEEAVVFTRGQLINHDTPPPPQLTRSKPSRPRFGGSEAASVSIIPSVCPSTTKHHNP